MEMQKHRKTFVVIHIAFIYISHNLLKQLSYRTMELLNCHLIDIYSMLSDMNSFCHTLPNETITAVFDWISGSQIPLSELSSIVRTLSP